MEPFLMPPLGISAQVGYLGLHHGQHSDNQAPERIAARQPASAS